jgi:hypothetical protein
VVIHRINWIGVDENGLAWVLNLMGDENRYPSQNSKAPANHFGVIVLKSLRWPGSYSCWQSGNKVQVYVGYGQKAERKTYYPIQPPVILREPKGLQEQPEPTPLEAPILEQPPVAEAPAE